MTPLEKVSEAYWNAFRDGFGQIGGPVWDYPKWSGSRDPIKNETMRCMRHAVEALREVWGKPFDEVFPDSPVKRSLKATKTDRAFARKPK